MTRETPWHQQTVPLKHGVQCYRKNCPTLNSKLKLLSGDPGMYYVLAAEEEEAEAQGKPLPNVERTAVGHWERAAVRVVPRSAHVDVT